MTETPVDEVATPDTVTMPAPSPALDRKVAKALPRLTELRSAAGLSQEEVAHRCHVSRFAVSRWESGGRIPTGYTAAALSVVLDELGAWS